MRSCSIIYVVTPLTTSCFFFSVQRAMRSLGEDVATRDEKIKKLTMEVLEAKEVRVEGQLMIEEAERRMKQNLRLQVKNYQNDTDRGKQNESSELLSLREENEKLGETIMALREWERDRVTRRSNLRSSGGAGVGLGVSVGGSR